MFGTINLIGPFGNGPGPLNKNLVMISPGPLPKGPVFWQKPPSHCLSSLSYLSKAIETNFFETETEIETLPVSGGDLQMAINWVN